MYHYLITVGIEPINSPNAGKVYLDSFLPYNESDVEKIQNTFTLSQDQLFKTTPEGASKVFDCNSLLGSLQSMILASKSKQTMFLHFLSEEELDKEFFKAYVESTPLEELKKSQLKI